MQRADWLRTTRCDDLRPEVTSLILKKSTSVQLRGDIGDNTCLLVVVEGANAAS